MGKFNGVLLASDLDGTLLTSENTISEENLAAIRYFQAEGGRFSVATGRSLIAFRPIFARLPINAPVLLSNGAVLFDYAAEHLYYAEYANERCKEDAAAILAHFPNVGFEVHALHKKFCLNRNSFIDFHADFVNCIIKDVARLADIEPPWIKVLFADSAETLREVAEWALPRFGSTSEMCFSSETLFEMQNKGITKGFGILKLAKQLGVRREDTYSAGDNQNDIPMLEAVESFAPENATGEAKAAAAHLVPHCDRHAIAAVIAFLDKRYS